MFALSIAYLTTDAMPSVTEKLLLPLPTFDSPAPGFKANKPSRDAQAAGTLYSCDANTTDVAQLSQDQSLIGPGRSTDDAERATDCCSSFKYE